MFAALLLTRYSFAKQSNPAVWASVGFYAEQMHKPTLGQMHNVYRIKLPTLLVSVLISYTAGSQGGHLLAKDISFFIHPQVPNPPLRLIKKVPGRGIRAKYLPAAPKRWHLCHIYGAMRWPRRILRSLHGFFTAMEFFSGIYSGIFLLSARSREYL